MNTPVRLMVSIVDRGNDKGVLHLLKEHGVKLYWCSCGCGTAHSEMMEFLGLTQPEKDLIFCIVDATVSADIMNDINKRLQFNRRGAGIMFTIPLAAINDDAAQYISGASKNTSNSEKEVVDMKNCSDYKLIVNVVSRGASDNVVKAAVGAGARGGTIMRSRGVTPDDVEDMGRMFFQPEKEVVLTVVKSEMSEGIVKAVCEAANKEAGERMISLTLPIEDVVGILSD